MNSARLVLIAFLCIALSSCVGPTPTTSPLETSPLPTPGSKISDDTVILDKTTPWSNPSQEVVIYRNKDRQYGFRVLSSGQTLFDFTLPDGEIFEDIIFSGETSDVAKEIGLITSMGNGTYKGRVYNVKLGTFVKDGNTGETSYLSVHVPPFLDDLDNDTIPELVAAYDDPKLPSGFVNNRIYVLSDGSYVESNFLILPPRELPPSK